MFYESAETPSWQAIDDIRTGSGTDLVFTYIDDFRDEPTIREDSWIGAETDGETIDGDMIVKAGATLTIEPGTELQFTSGSELKVYGTLNAEDVTLTASGTSWEGIYFASGSDGTLDGVTVDKTSGSVITIYNASPTIENSTITVSGSNKIAISVNGSSAAPVIHDNTNIQTDPYHTIHVYGWAAPRIYENEDLRNASSGSYAVLYAGYYAAPYFGPSGGDPGYNQINEGGYGIYATNNATVQAGGGSGDDYGRNTFCDQATAHLYASSNSVIYAAHNYWLAGNPVTSGSGTIYTFPAYSTSCTSSKRAVAGGAREAGFSTLGESDASSDPRNLLLAGRKHLEAGQFAQAASRWMELVDAYPKASEAGAALAELGHLFTRTQDAEVLRFMERTADSEHPRQATALEVLVHCYQVTGKDALAQSTAERAISLGDVSGRSFQARTSAFQVHFEAGRYTAAASVLDSMQPKDEDEEEAFRSLQWLLHLETGDLVSDPEKRAPAPSAASSKDEGTATDEALTVHAYPNPFNPVTTIRYTVLEAGSVTLTVYDVRGREVATLVNGVQEAGAHEAVFDASSLPTGTYVYRLEAGRQTVTGTMLLMK